VKIFAVIILKIDRLITTVENKSEEVNLHKFSHVEILEKVKVKLLFEYHDYLDMFDWAMINQLSSHRFYDHKIELIDEETLSRSKLYQMFDHKLQKIKKYLIDHLNKEFIFFSFASYVSLILFVEEKDDSLRFCVDYRKLNALIKRDHYSLSLIDETLAHIQESKYLTRLNIIVAFNKLHMHSDSKDLTIFIIFFDSYKYHVMLFKLTNESMFYQHYMNDVLFKYLHQFCQIYLNDIIIYSKILKKHKRHVRLILNRLREADLQIDINKCEFHVQNWRWTRERCKQSLIDLHSIISLRCSSSLTSAISINASSRTFQRLFIQWFNSLKRKSYLNEMKSVRLSSIIWRDVWSKLLYYVTLIKLMRLFSKSTHLTTSTMKFSLNIMMKKYYIWLSFIARTCLLLNATTRYMIKNFWSSFEHLNTDDLNWS